jgi:phosphoglucosamine mutase
VKHLIPDRDKVFGTDGIRGTPGVYPLTDDMLRVIARSIGWQASQNKGRRVKKVVIGKDTRASGGKIERILSDNIRDFGVDVLLEGTITTPGLSFLVKKYKADIGIMISASHNKAQDNGIKFFNSRGYKYSQEEEEDVEDIIFEMLAGSAEFRPAKDNGTVKVLKDAQKLYSAFLASTVRNLDLNGTTVALDCAWGAASPFARGIFERLGATVHAIHDSPSAENINEGGAVNPVLLKKLVLETGADMGIAVDGDGDRGILVDEKGEVLDGDTILAVIARYMIAHKTLNAKTVVGTVMSNYGLKQSISECGGRLLCTNVGDKFVLEALLKNDLNLGGEQSGHIIFFDHCATPDGILTALQMLRVIKERSSPLSELRKCFTKFPQILVNVKVRQRKPFDDVSAVLKDEGRVLLRYSGTEFLARVMVEGRDKVRIETLANELADVIRHEIGVEPEGKK